MSLICCQKNTRKDTFVVFKLFPTLLQFKKGTEQLFPALLQFKRGTEQLFPPLFQFKRDTKQLFPPLLQFKRGTKQLFPPLLQFKKGTKQLFPPLFQPSTRQFAISDYLIFFDLLFFHSIFSKPLVSQNIFSMIGDDDVGTGTGEGVHIFHHYFLFVNPFFL